MNHDLPEPLDPQERALAGALSRLPAVEPPPPLDARVLATARGALQGERRALPGKRRRPWWLGAGLGTAAAAVLAAGVAWQAGLFHIDYGSSLPVPRTHAPTTAAPDAIDTVDVDLNHRATPRSSPVASEALPESPMQRADVPPAAAGQAARTKTTLPAPEAQTIMPPPPPPSPARQDRAQADAADLAPDPATLGNPSMAPAPPALLPHWREDAQLEPDAWIERVRERVRQGDRPGAVQSLRLYQRQHPSGSIPNDLLRLLAG